MKQMDNIPYKFIPIPLHLYMCLDNNCRSVLFALIQLSSFYTTDGGWFFRSNADLEAETNLSTKVLNGALDALYSEGVIDIIPQACGRGKKQESRKYKVNFDKFLEFEKFSIEDCTKNPDYAIETRDYRHGAPSFQRKEPSSEQTSEQSSEQSTNNIDNIENKENEENTDTISCNNIYIKEPDGDSSFSSSPVESSCSEPTVIGTSCAIPTYSFSKSVSSSPSPSSTPKGASAITEKGEKHFIPREKEISSQQQSNTNASEGTVSMSVPSQVWDGDSCATKDEVPIEIREMRAALDILEDYDLNHKPFDSTSGQALKTAISLAMTAWNYDYEQAKKFIQNYRKETIRLAKEGQDDERARIDAEVAKVAAILNDDPKPKPDYGEFSKVFVDVDALDSDDYNYDHAW